METMESYFTFNKHGVYVSFAMLFLLFSLVSLSAVVEVKKNSNSLGVNVFEPPTSSPINYSTVNVNDSLYWQGHTGTDGSWLTGIMNIFDQTLNTTSKVKFDNLTVTTNLTIGDIIGARKMQLGKVGGSTITLDMYNLNQGLRIENANAANISFSTYLTGDSFVRYRFYGDGSMGWGSGTSSTDTNLYRSGASILKTDDHFVVALNLTVMHLAGTGNAYVCVNSTGVLYRSGSACV